MKKPRPPKVTSRQLAISILALAATGGGVVVAILYSIVVYLSTLRR